MSDMKRVILKKGKDQALKRRHPWIFSGAIAKKEGEPQDGDVVEVVSQKGKTLATGHFQNGSIMVRIFAFHKQELNRDYWKTLFERALAKRRAVDLPSNDTNAYRLFFGEGDGVPGLVVDVYAHIAVIQCHSVGVYKAREDVADELMALEGAGIKAVYDKSAESLKVAKKWENKPVNSYLRGNGEALVVEENGHKFMVDWENGQKTGFFLDQRDNRSLLATYSAGKKVLNTFCYTGGFSVYALKAGAERIDSVDVSKRAIDLTDENMELNGADGSKSSGFAVDTFDYLKEHGHEYDVIVLDPPAFAKHRDARHRAVIGYKRLNEMALRRLPKGGILFTFSCSQVIDRKLFIDTVRAAAIETGRNISILHHLDQPADHPINIYHPEGEYLKGLVVRVDD